MGCLEHRNCILCVWVFRLELTLGSMHAIVWVLDQAEVQAWSWFRLRCCLRLVPHAELWFTLRLEHMVRQTLRLRAHAQLGR